MNKLIKLLIISAIVASALIANFTVKYFKAYDQSLQEQNDYLLKQVVILNAKLDSLICIDSQPTALQITKAPLAKKISSVPPHVYDHISNIYRLSQMVTDSYNIPIKLTIAISCLETGYGRSSFCTDSLNYFGIRTNHKYCRYNTMEESFHHYGRTMNQKCYRGASPKTIVGWYVALGICHYAANAITYAEKLDFVMKLYISNHIFKTTKPIVT